MHVVVGSHFTFREASKVISQYELQGEREIYCEGGKLLQQSKEFKNKKQKTLSLHSGAR